MRDRKAESMNKVYQETMELRACHCDMGGLWRPSAIMEAMQETAGAHSTNLGLSRKVMDDMGVAWVLSRVQVDMQRMPHIGERITILTYPTVNKHLFFPRSHVFYDETGAQIGCANSLWLVMDLRERRLVRSQEVLLHMPDNSDRTPAAGMPATVRALPGDVKTGSYTAQYTDLDVNRHVNNTRYLDWCCNALGTAVMDAHALSSFDVNYDAEILPDTGVRTELTRDGLHFVFCGYEGDKRHFGISGTLTPRG